MQNALNKNASEQKRTMSIIGWLFVVLALFIDPLIRVTYRIKVLFIYNFFFPFEVITALDTGPAFIWKWLFTFLLARTQNDSIYSSLKRKKKKAITTYSVQWRNRCQNIFHFISSFFFRWIIGFRSVLIIFLNSMAASITAYWLHRACVCVNSHNRMIFFSVSHWNEISIFRWKSIKYEILWILIV